MASNYTNAVDIFGGVVGGAASLQSGAASTVAGECERLFCETLRAVFLGESRADACGSLLAAGMRTNSEDACIQSRRSVEGHERRAGMKVQRRHRGMKEQARLLGGRRHRAPDGFAEERGFIQEWVEVFDYRGDASFRGFIAKGPCADKTLLVFFDQSVVGKELKHAYAPSTESYLSMTLTHVLQSNYSPGALR